MVGQQNTANDFESKVKIIMLNFRGLTHQNYFSYPGAVLRKFTIYFLCCLIEKFHRDTQFENYLKIIEFFFFGFSVFFNVKTLVRKN